MKCVKGIFTALALVSASASAVVDININGDLYRYQQPVRLTQALAPVVKNGDWYWAASALYKKDEGELEAKRHEIISELDEMMVELRPSEDKAIALRKLRQQIEGWTLAKRLPVKINYDAARLDIRQNPLIKDGEYTLILSGRPDVIWMSGLVETPGSYQYQAQKSPYQYAQGVALRDDAENDFVYVISPEGEISKREIAYWNRSYNQLMPGSQVYIPLYSWLFFWDLDELNQKIAELAVHRVLL